MARQRRPAAPQPAQRGRSRLLQEEEYESQIPHPKLGGGLRGTPPIGRPVGFIDADEVMAFVYDSHPLWVNSSNVQQVQYFIESQKMVIWFDNGVYEYSPISEQEAILFTRAPSKGMWCWTYLRVRGSKTAHRKSYRRIR